MQCTSGLRGIALLADADIRDGDLDSAADHVVNGVLELRPKIAQLKTAATRLARRR